VKKAGGKYELIGGSEADRAEAEKWVAMFLKYVVVPPSLHAESSRGFGHQSETEP